MTDQVEFYAKAVLKVAKLNTVAQQREAVTRGRSLLPYRLRYIFLCKFCYGNNCCSIPFVEGFTASCCDESRRTF
ncbi:MAG: hypothetical protein LBK06_06720 [Planctomycetaceae bacterium]|nr:hypothetical protein [Planctomycetaceae bacterium]